MAIYSLSLRSIGKSTHAAGTAGAHLRYIARDGAAPVILAQHMPEDAQDARTWMDQHERSARKNARLADKIMIALPRELNEAQRAGLLRDFMNDLTAGGRVPYFAAIHQTGKDAYNPHGHICLVDRDIESGKRVLCLSDNIRDRKKKGLPGPSAVDWVRERWEHHANTALKQAGFDARIDRRSLEAQGIDRAPTIHIGPNAQYVDTMVDRPQSKAVADPTHNHPNRIIDYPRIDQGRTRREYNHQIIDLNLERAARSADFETKVWAQFEKDQRAKDFNAEQILIDIARRHTARERSVRRTVSEHAQTARGVRNADVKLARAWVNQQAKQDMAALKSRQLTESNALKESQSRILSRLASIFDLTGRTRAAHRQARQELYDHHLGERQSRRLGFQEQRTSRLTAAQMRYRTQLKSIVQDKKTALRALRGREEADLRQADEILQRRVNAREQTRMAVQEQIANWKQANKTPPAPQRRHGNPKDAALARIKNHPEMRRAWEQMTPDGKRDFLETLIEHERGRKAASQPSHQRQASGHDDDYSFDP